MLARHFLNKFENGAWAVRLEKCIREREALSKAFNNGALKTVFLAILDIHHSLW